MRQFLIWLLHLALRNGERSTIFPSLVLRDVAHEPALQQTNDSDADMSQPAAPPDVPQPPSHQVVAVSPPPSPLPSAHTYESEPRRQPRLWRVVKWPLRQIIKGIYLPLAAARRHKRATLLALVVLAVAFAGAFGVYRVTHPDSAPSRAAGSTSSASTGLPAQPETPFTITSAAQPALPTSVIHALHGYKANDAHEFFGAMSPQYQNFLKSAGRDEAHIQAAFDQRKQSGVTFQQFIYTGGFVASDGSDAYFTFTVVLDQGGQMIEVPLYFAVDQTGLISNYSVLTLAPQG